MANNDEIAALVGSQRLARFAQSTTPAASRHGLHEWNFNAAAAVLATAGRMEILVRRAASVQLTAISRARGSEHWSLGLALDAHELRTIRWAQRHVDETSDSVESSCLLEEHLPMGFWLQLVTNRYHTRLWVPGLAKAFPHIPRSAGERREALHWALSRSVALRNLAAHFHPLHSFHAEEVLQPFAAVAAAIHPEAAEWLAESSRIAQVWSSLPGGQVNRIPGQPTVTEAVTDSCCRLQSTEGSPLRSE